MRPKTFIRKYKQGDNVYYAEVWNERHGKTVIQHYVQYLGTDPNRRPPPTSFTIEKVHFGFLAQLILWDELVPDDLYTMLKGMGEPVRRRELRGIILRYDLKKKKLRLQLVPARKRPTSAPGARGASCRRTPTGGRSPSSGGWSTRTSRW